MRCHKVQMARHRHTLCSVNAKHTRGVLNETHFEYNCIEQNAVTVSSEKCTQSRYRMCALAPSEQKSSPEEETPAYPSLLSQPHLAI